jgi:hypothetical protein
MGHRFDINHKCDKTCPNLTFWMESKVIHHVLVIVKKNSN